MYNSDRYDGMGLYLCASSLHKRQFWKLSSHVVHPPVCKQLGEVLFEGKVDENRKLNPKVYTIIVCQLIRDFYWFILYCFISGSNKKTSNKYSLDPGQ